MAPIPSPGTNGNDTIVPATGTNQDIYGDPYNIDPLIKGKGGNDTLIATGVSSSLFGEGAMMLDDARSGNDRLESFGSGSELLGDGRGMFGNNQGGNDTLIAHNESGDANELLGDADRLFQTSRGGGDTLIVHSESGDSNALYGDAERLLDTSRGGNDRLIGGMGDDLVVGDAASMDPGALGGNDNLWGDPTGAGSGGEDFFFTGLIGKDTVFDFRPDDGDKIGLDYGAVLDEFGELVFSEAGGSTLIDIGASLGGPANTHTIRLAGFDDLQETDVVFSPIII